MDKGVIFILSFLCLWIGIGIGMGSKLMSKAIENKLKKDLEAPCVALVHLTNAHKQETSIAGYLKLNNCSNTYIAEYIEKLSHQLCHPDDYPCHNFKISEINKCSELLK